MSNNKKTKKNFYFFSPEYFGKDCEGESKGHYETCNTQDCSEGIDDLHMKQCKDKDPSYTTYHDSKLFFHHHSLPPCLLPYLSRLYP